MMTIGIWIVGYSLVMKKAALTNCLDLKNKKIVILMKLGNFISKNFYKQQKLTLLWSDRQHFAQKLNAAGWQVTNEY